ncbi:MAG: hypothetical protein WCI22_06955 [Actinomycetota bacterium]
MQRRKMLSRTWAAVVVGWSLVRTFIIWAAVRDYGFNPWIYLGIDLASATIDAVSTPRMVIAFIDDHYRTALKWAAVSLVAFVVPDIYVFLGTRTLPTRIIVMLCIIIGLTLVAGVVTVVRKVRKGRRQHRSFPAT